jgi:hypothetical protein
MTSSMHLPFSARRRSVYDNDDSRVVHKLRWLRRVAQLTFCAAGKVGEKEWTIGAAGQMRRCSNAYIRAH